jgi:hypothetical protein
LSYPCWVSEKASSTISDLTHGLITLCGPSGLQMAPVLVDLWSMESLKFVRGEIDSRSHMKNWCGDL